MVGVILGDSPEWFYWLLSGVLIAALVAIVALLVFAVALFVRQRRLRS